MVVPEQLSLADAVKETTAPEPDGPPALGHTTIFAGQVTLGFSVSITVTVKLQLALFPTASVAVQMTVVTPLKKVVPDGGEKVRFATPEQLSVAVAM